MGSGDRVKFMFVPQVFGVGVSVSRFPFWLTIHVEFLFWQLSIGFGKGYDQ